MIACMKKLLKGLLETSAFSPVYTSRHLGTEVFSYVYTNNTCVSVRMLPICRICNGAASHGPLPSTRGHSPKCRREAVESGTVRVRPARMHECTHMCE